MKISTILDHIDSGHIPAPASGAVFACFTASADFRAYVETEFLTWKRPDHPSHGYDRA